MLGGKPLPALTGLVIHGKVGFILLSLFLPVIAIFAAIRVRRRGYTLYWLGGIMLIAFIQGSLTAFALFLPRTGTISGMPANG